jgi:hypothetical protein
MFRKRAEQAMEIDEKVSESFRSFHVSEARS